MPVIPFSKRDAGPENEIAETPETECAREACRNDPESFENGRFRGIGQSAVIRVPNKMFPFYIVAGFIRALAVVRRSRLTDSDSIAKPASQANG
jgi:hypothetical protein